MTQPRQPASNPSMGRLVLVAAAVVGAGALMGYGTVKMQERRQANAEDEARTPAQAESGVDALLARAREARRTLDTAALQRVGSELAAATQAEPRALELETERVAVLASLSLESCVRAKLGGRPDPDAAKRVEALAEGLGAALDPGVALSVRARNAFCRGEGDVIGQYPAVLLPSFRDRELRSLLAAQPLLSALGSPSAEPSDERMRAELTRALAQLPEPTTFERLVLALALPDSDPRTKGLVDDVLAAVPTQPLALAIREHLRDRARVAVADPLPTEPAEPDTTVVEPKKPEPDTTVVEPEPAEPEPVEPEPAEPEPAEPKKPSQPKKPSAGQSKPKAPVDLAEEGCDLVRSGKAEQGFAILQKAFDQDPRDNKVILCMAEGHMKLGRLPSGRAMVERVLRSSPKNKKALQLAAKIEDQLGNERSAADYYRKLLELEPDNATAQAYVDKHGG